MTWNQLSGIDEAGRTRAVWTAAVDFRKAYTSACTRRLAGDGGGSSPSILVSGTDGAGTEHIR